MNQHIKKLADACWSHRIDGTLIDGDLHFDYNKFAELILQDIYNQVKEELVDDSLIDAESDIEDRCYLRGCNGGIVDALCIIQNYGKGIES